MEQGNYNPFLISFKDSDDSRDKSGVDFGGEEVNNEINIFQVVENFESQRASQADNEKEKSADVFFDEKIENQQENKKEEEGEEGEKEEIIKQKNLDESAEKEKLLDENKKIEIKEKELSEEEREGKNKEKDVEEEKEKTLENKFLSDTKKSEENLIKEAVYLIETDKIRPNSQQPRRYFHPESLYELSESIKEYGILQPLILTRIEEEADFGSTVSYELIAGERRWRAAQILGLERVPAIIRDSMEEKQKLEAAIIENVQRQDLNSIEAARAYAKLADEFGLPQREIARRIGISREAVANSLRLLQLPTEAQKALIENKISESHARVILTVSNPEKQRGLLGEILSKKLTVREAESLIKQAGESLENLREKNISQPNNQENKAIESSIKTRLEEILGTKVEVKKKGDRGKITINFFSDEELLEILKKIVGDIEK